MKRNKLTSIKEIDWFLYLTRPLNIFSFICNAKAYEKIRYLGGIRNTGYLYKNQLAEYYRNKEEFSKNLRLLKNNILNNPKKIEKELIIGLEYNKKAKKILDQFKKNTGFKPDKKELINLINFYIDLFAYSTVFPYMAGLSLEKYKLKKLKIKKLIEQLRSISYYTDFASDVLGKYFKKILKKEKIKNLSLLDYTPDEVISFLKTGELNKKRRKVLYYFVVKDSKIIGSEKRVFKDIKKIINSEIKDKVKNLKGNVAYKGFIKGKVKIVHNKNDFSKFNQGDILVTISSNPSLMPVIRKCGAIIADEGGMTCHAAIISRELKIPCIIGTKIATKFLKDGDLVEVDANKGIVKIIK